MLAPLSPVDQIETRTGFVGESLRQAVHRERRRAPLAIPRRPPPSAPARRLAEDRRLQMMYAPPYAWLGDPVAAQWGARLEEQEP